MTVLRVTCTIRVSDHCQNFKGNEIGIKWFCEEFAVDRLMEFNRPHAISFLLTDHFTVSVVIYDRYNVSTLLSTTFFVAIVEKNILENKTKPNAVDK